MYTRIHDKEGLYQSVCCTTQHPTELQSPCLVVTELSLSLNSHLVKIVRAESVNEGSFPDCSISQGDQSEGVGGDHLAPVHRHPHSLTSQL